MSQATGTAKPSKDAVRLTVEESSVSSGKTAFYEDLTTQLQEVSHNEAENGSPNIQQPVHSGPVDAAMPSSDNTGTTMTAMPAPTTERSPPPPPTCLLYTSPSPRD